MRVLNWLVRSGGGIGEAEVTVRVLCCLWFVQLCDYSSLRPYARTSILTSRSKLVLCLKFIFVVVGFSRLVMTCMNFISKNLIVSSRAQRSPPYSSLQYVFHIAHFKIVIVVSRAALRGLDEMLSAIQSSLHCLSEGQR